MWRRRDGALYSRHLNERGRSVRLGPGLAIGVGVGAAIGVALGDIAVGVGVGAGVGIALGAAFGSHRSPRHDDEEANESRKKTEGDCGWSLG